MKKLQILTVIILLVTSFMPAQNYYAELKTAYLLPTDQVFKDVYKGGIVPQLEFGIKVLNKLEVFLNIGYFARTGELTFTKEETKVNIISFSLGGRYLIVVGNFTPYAAVGLSYNLYNEESEVFESLNHSGLGFLIQVGGYFKLSSNLKLDVFLNYDNCQMEPGAVKFNIGGIKAGIGLRLDF